MSEINNLPPNSPIPSSTNNSTVIKAVVISVIITLILAGSAFAYLQKISNKEQGSVTEEEETTEVNILEEITYYEDLIKTDPVDIFNLTKDEFGYSSGEFQIKESSAFKFGEINEGKYKGGELIVMDVAMDGPVFYPVFVRLIKMPSSETIVLDKYSLLDWGPDESKFTLDTEFELPKFDPPLTLELGASNKKVVLDTTMRANFENANKSKYYQVPDLGTIYIDAKITDQTLNGFYLRLPDGSQASYKYQPRFIPANNIPNITFTDGSTNKTEYGFTSVNGCGSSNFINIVNKSELSSALIVGKTSTGSDIYAPNTNSAYVRNYYDNFYNVPYDTVKATFEEFVQDYPILFFEDPFGRIAVLTNAAFVPAAECGKPVIYLYPEKTTQVSVKVYPMGGFTYTDPNYEKYGDGWNVITTPNSQMYEIEDPLKTVYPYLFWEGRGGIYKAPERGFVVKKAEVSDFLSEKLSFLGFNSTEIADFKEFWLPRMQEYPYYTVSFLGNKSMDILAPLEITPKPDTVIRVLMDYKGHNKRPNIKQQVLQKGPERKGFTVTEWGGVIQ